MHPLPVVLASTLLALSLSAQAGPIIETRLPPLQSGAGAQDSHEPANPEARKQWQAGRVALGQGDMKAAEAAFKQATQLDAKAGAPWVGLGDVALRRGDLKGAQAAVMEALKRDPKHQPARLAQARLAVLTGDAAQAEQLLKALVQQEPRFLPAQTDLGELYLNTNRPALAEPVFKQAQSVPGAGWPVWQGLVRAQVRLNRQSEAMQTLEKAAAEFPGNAQPWIAAAELAQSQGDRVASLRHAQQAVKSDGKSVPAQMALADALVANDQTAKAIEGLQSLLSLPDVPAALVHTKVAMIKAGRKDLDGAQAAYRLALRADPKYHPALNNLAWMNAERKVELDEALRSARRAVEVQPNQPSYVDTLAFVHLARKEPKLALDVLNKALKAQPSQPLLLMRLAQTHQAMDDLSKAREAVDQALKLAPNFKEAQELKQKLGGGR